MLLLLFDIGGTNVKYGLMKDGQLIFSDKFKTLANNGAKDIFERVIKLSEDIIFQHKKIDGISISSAGVIDNINHIVFSASDSIPGLSGFEIKKVLEERLGLKVITENDVNCFAISESAVGASKDFSNVLTLTIGTGIGGALIINNKLYVGKTFSAGEVGQMLIDDKKFEELASMSALVLSAQNAELDVKNGYDVFKLYDEANETAINVVNQFYKNLAKGITNLVYILNPEVVVIGGGLSERVGFVEELEIHINEVIQERFLNTFVVKAALNKNEAGLIGAYYNYLDKSN